MTARSALRHSLRLRLRSSGLRRPLVPMSSYNDYYANSQELTTLGARVVIKIKYYHFIIMTSIITNIFSIIINPKFFVPVIIIGIIIIVGNIFKSTVQQKMKTSLFNFAGIDIDGWSISHVLLYIYFGYNFPMYFAEFLIIGTIWEIFENLFCKESFEKIINSRDSDNFFCNNIRQFNSCDYWYGKVDDVAMNMIGFVIGACLAKNKK